MRLFALEPDADLGHRVAGELGLELSPLEERVFEDGEGKLRPLASVRNQDVFVLHSLYGDADRSVHDKLCRLLFFLACVRDAGAARVNAVIPYLCYARKDRRTQPRDPVTSRYVAQLFESVGVDRVVAMDVHNPAAFDNAFRCRAHQLEARELFVERLAFDAPSPVIVSPDVGGIKRAALWRDALEARLGRPIAQAFVEKRRSLGVLSGEALVGEVRGCTAVLVDDLISSGNTLLRAARACRAAGASGVIAAATHGVFAPEAETVMSDPALDRVLVSDSVAPRLALPKLEVLDVAPVLARGLADLGHSGAASEHLR